MERNHICKKCGGIAGWDSYYQSWICTRCRDVEHKPTTNADRIRAMTDEELADWLTISVIPRVCEIPLKAGNEPMLDKWLDWLKQEVKK